MYWFGVMIPEMLGPHAEHDHLVDAVHRREVPLVGDVQVHLLAPRARVRFLDKSIGYVTGILPKYGCGNRRS